MEISLLLAEKIAAMFLMCLCGYALVKFRLLKPTDSRILSVVLVYVCCPLVSIYSFQIDCTAEKMKGLLFAICVVTALHVFMIAFTRLIEKPFRLDPVERASIIYSNSGNLVIPLVTQVLGEEWLFYTMAYMFIQTLLIWTHGVVLIGRKEDTDIRKILQNPNIAALFLGFALFLCHVSLPAVVNDCMSGFSNILGPVAMLVTGMLIGDTDLKAIVSRKRAWFVCLCRLIVIPVAALALIRLTGIASLHPDGKMILTVIMLATSASVANTVTQQAQLYDNEPVYASSINILSVIGCIVTMPVIIFLLETWI